MIIDERLENKDIVVEWAERYGIKRVLISAYHLQTNRIIKRGHKPIVNAPLKMSAGRSINGVQNLPVVLWADQSIVRMSTSLTPYYINCRSKSVFSIKL